ncbi:UDP-N-acetylmuramate dehydrogenase [Candidatus Pandoraea novymonadis]|uniref:UDP-N-acetylenolpyruvoylglucosamine reductase n=1 Tax=Candidatus Pandoraea novymonadis TaxID=1808959 RepID=A0ABX5FDT6_9BURK|nr:UDP-N-acetylmuramate dehydrogenase [Candidatus Pandoraea novymonadis]PSB91894.1 UDP-N-acetylenolpyruvoylglucosamine reductase [Candidatus Pandoraea novymonadis]
MPELYREFSLRNFNTFNLSAMAQLAVVVHSEDDLRRVLAMSEVARLPCLVIGGGSNLVFTRDFDGLIILMRIQGRRFVGMQEDAWIIEVGAGEVWHNFVEWTLDIGCPGLENLALIPGTVGAAPIQNIGAYGIEVAERLHSVRAFDTTTRTFVTLDAEACAFGYRDSLFKKNASRYILTQVTFRLPYPWQSVIRYAELARTLPEQTIKKLSARDIFNSVIGIRRDKLPDPVTMGNAGSFFKNPVLDASTFIALRERFPNVIAYEQPSGDWKLSAGWMIDQCGWRGKTLRKAGVYERQALILVNLGGASGVDVLTLANAIQTSVMERFGVKLEIEPLVL